jgi:hypothetical protein
MLTRTQAELMYRFDVDLVQVDTEITAPRNYCHFQSTVVSCCMKTIVWNQFLLWPQHLNYSFSHGSVKFLQPLPKIYCASRHLLQYPAHLHLTY